MYGLESPMAVLLAVTLQAPWLVPYEKELYWMVPAAMVVLLVPFFFVSVFFERSVLLRTWKNEEKAAIIAHSWKSHIYSYAFLFIVVAALGFFSIYS